MSRLSFEAICRLSSVNSFFFSLSLSLAFHYSHHMTIKVSQKFEVLTFEIRFNQSNQRTSPHLEPTKFDWLHCVMPIFFFFFLFSFLLFFNFFFFFTYNNTGVSRTMYSSEKKIRDYYFFAYRIKLFLDYASFFFNFLLF